MRARALARERNGSEAKCTRGWTPEPREPERITQTDSATLITRGEVSTGRVVVGYDLGQIADFPARAGQVAGEPLLLAADQTRDSNPPTASKAERRKTIAQARSRARACRARRRSPASGLSRSSSQIGSSRSFSPARTRACTAPNRG